MTDEEYNATIWTGEFTGTKSDMISVTGDGLDHLSQLLSGDMTSIISVDELHITLEDEGTLIIGTEDGELAIDRSDSESSGKWDHVGSTMNIDAEGGLSRLYSNTESGMISVERLRIVQPNGDILNLSVSNDSVAIQRSNVETEVETGP